MKLFVFVGIAGSGKSTFYKHQFADTHVRINLDMLRTRHREATLFRACVEGKALTVVDNTNLTIDARKAYLEPALKAHYEVEAYFFDTPLDEALRRNAGREGKARVPDNAIRSMYRQLEIPTRAEGFNRVYRVTARDEHAFNVEEMSE